jgi:hypothetical protein
MKRKDHLEAKRNEKIEAKRSEMKRKNWSCVIALACENQAKRIPFRFEAKNFFMRNRRTLVANIS